jgi:hypothetical protein
MGRRPSQTSDPPTHSKNSSGKLAFYTCLLFMPILVACGIHKLLQAHSYEPDASNQELIKLYAKYDRNSDGFLDLKYASHI